MVHTKLQKKKEWSSHLLKACFCSDAQKSAAPLHSLTLFLPSFLLITISAFSQLEFWCL